MADPQLCSSYSMLFDQLEIGLTQVNPSTKKCAIFYPVDKKRMARYIPG